MTLTFIYSLPGFSYAFNEKDALLRFSSDNNFSTKIMEISESGVF